MDEFLGIVLVRLVLVFFAVVVFWSGSVLVWFMIKPFEFKRRKNDQRNDANPRPSIEITLLRLSLSSLKLLKVF